MALYQLKCETCGKQVRKLLDSPDLLADVKCDCGGSLVRNGVGPSSAVYEVLDSGAMPRAVERLRDAEELYKERSKNADARAGIAKK